MIKYGWNPNKSYQSGPRSIGNERGTHICQGSRTEALTSDGLSRILGGGGWGASYPSPGRQLAYSAAQTDSAIFWLLIYNNYQQPAVLSEWLA